MTVFSITSITRFLTVAVFFTAVASPVLLFGHDGPWFGPPGLSVNKTRLFPQKLNPSTFAALDEWFADHVGLRFPLIYIGTELHIGLLRRPIDRHIFFGREGWMFWTDNGDSVPATMADARGKLRFAPTEIMRIDSRLRLMREQFKACSIPFEIVIAPNKESIYGRYLFSDKNATPEKRLDALLVGLSEPARSLIVDPRPAMMAAAAAADPILLYPKTETHWNELGAFHAYRAMMTALARKMPIEHPETLSLDRYDVKSFAFPGGDMAVYMLFSPWRFKDEFVSVTPKAPTGIEETTVRVGYTIFRNPNAKGRLLVFGDSFALATLRFLAQNFGEVHGYRELHVDGGVAAQIRPTAVIWLMAERHTQRMLEPDVDLPQLCAK